MNSFFNKNVIKLLSNRYSLLISIILFGLLSSLTSGCSIFSAQPERKVNYFDIGFPDTSQSTSLKMPLIINSFVSTSPYFARMVFRTSEMYLDMDDYNRWSSPPALMLKRYFILALESKSIDEVVMSKAFLELNATILSLEADTQKKLVTLIIKIDIKYGQNESLVNSEIIEIQEPLTEVSANQFAKTLRIAADKAVEKTLTALNKVSP